MKIYTLSQITGAEHFSQSLAAPENPGGGREGLLPGRVMAENPECWLHVLAGTKLGPKDHSPVECRGGGRARRERHF